jgi:hypothetical protein
MMMMVVKIGARASMIRVAAEKDSLCEFPLQIPSEGDVSWFFYSFICPISDLKSWGEIV